MRDGGKWNRALQVVVVGLIVGGVAGMPAAADGACGRLASVQNDVQTKAAKAGAWEPATRDEELFALDRVRTGPDSRAAILYSDQTLHRINEKSEVEILAPGDDSPGVLKVLSGQHYFSTRKPKDYGRVETPTVTAAIRGTEFVVDVAEGGTTTITMIEGVVDASNEYGELRVGAGEAAYVEPGKAPVRRVVVRPRDAVTWSLYYPPVLGGNDAQRLRALGEPGRDLARAAELLSSGQVDSARPLIASARERAPHEPVALALASVIELVEDRKDEALTLARQAVEADATSGSAALALSFAEQAAFDIAGAREAAETAARVDPDNAEALARVAELRMAEGDTSGAADAAERAVRRDPGSARALTVLGFARLAELRSVEALATFQRAVDADPGFPLARLGMGIAKIRTGAMNAGREEMQTAVILDPDNSLLRSYLAKAYFEEKRPEEAEKELGEAKTLDPADPTPYLYQAILQQTYNRPVEALGNLQRSIDLNDQRAVYRSRLLLDEDLAVRGADLAGIYNDLGFDRLGMVTARRSADIDQSNYSSHLFLAGTYRNLPQFAPAFLSETLQARIYQPVNVNAVRPDVVNESASFNEYTSLIGRPRLRGFAGAAYGSTSTDLGDYFQPGDVCLDPQGNVGPCVDIVQLNDSTPSGGNATVTINRDRFAGAISYDTFQSDGFRVNNDTDSSTVRGFAVWAPTYRDQVQVNVIDGRRKTGDLPLRDFPVVIGLERVTTDLTNIGLGYRRVVSPAADLAISAIYSKTMQDLAIPLFAQAGSAELKGPQIEAQYVLRRPGVTWTAGAGYFDGDQSVSSEFLGSSTTASGTDRFANGYVYARFHGLGAVELTGGLSWEDAEVPIGLLPPRDSNIGIGNVRYDDSQLSGKFGLSWAATPTTVVRATAFSRLTPAIGRLQTLEPTQVAGFNQFYDDAGGSSSVNYGVGLDQRFGTHVFTGFSLLRRNLDVPEPTCAAPDPAIGCPFQPAVGVAMRSSDDWLGNLYVNATLGRRVALGLDYAYEERAFDFTQLSNNSLFEDYVETQRLRPQARVFLPMGFFATLRGTNYDQSVDQFDDLSSAARSTINADFWIADVGLGYRLPKRLGSVSLDVYNLGDRKFTFYRSSLEEDVVPARTVLLNVSFTSP